MRPRTTKYPAHDLPGTRIAIFKGKYAFLSNSYPCQVVGADGLLYPSVENAYQASKTEDWVLKMPYTQTVPPNLAAQLGQSFKPSVEWTANRLSTMTAIVQDKFSRNSELKTKLLNTGDRYIEYVTETDAYWGTVKGKGENNLGKILMDVRESLKNGYQIYIPTGGTK